MAIENGERDSIYQLRRSYVRENKSDTCFTLMADMGEGGHNQPVIKDRWGIRKLTPRECARLQGYTDDWVQVPDPEVVSLTQIYKQIGNSVTIPLVVRLAENALLLRHLCDYAVVHLTWSGKEESGPAWPACQIYADADDLMEQCIGPAHQEYEGRGNRRTRRWTE